MKSSQVGWTAWGRIYKNGVAFGTEHSDGSGNYVTKTQDLTFATGDTIQLYIKVQTPEDVFVKNFKALIQSIRGLNISID